MNSTLFANWRAPQLCAFVERLEQLGWVRAWAARQTDYAHYVYEVFKRDGKEHVIIVEYVFGMGVTISTFPSNHESELMV